jgi:hypothetical protein
MMHINTSPERPAFLAKAHLLYIHERFLGKKNNEELLFSTGKE